MYVPLFLPGYVWYKLCSDQVYVFSYIHSIIIKYGIGGIDKEYMECNIFARIETHLTIGFSRKTELNALAQL